MLFFQQVWALQWSSFHSTLVSTIMSSSPGRCSTFSHHSLGSCRGSTATTRGTVQTAPTGLTTAQSVTFTRPPLLRSTLSKLAWTIVIHVFLMFWMTDKWSCFKKKSMVCNSKASSEPHYDSDVAYELNKFHNKNCRKGKMSTSVLKNFAAFILEQILNVWIEWKILLNIRYDLQHLAAFGPWNLRPLKMNRCLFFQQVRGRFVVTVEACDP